MIIVNAPAKINLSLNVGAPCLEAGEFYGYHPINSLVVFANDCADRLHFCAATNLSLKIIGEFGHLLAADENNLVLRAAHLIKQKFDVNLGANITLVKNLPIASGIGGGSADCAATIIGLSQLWRLGLNQMQMKEIGKSLGADVPACIMGQPLIMKGFGEFTAKAPIFNNLYAVLVNPLIGLSTPKVYSNFDDIGDFPKSIDINYHDCNSLEETIDMLLQQSNHLEPAAINILPQIGEVIVALSALKGQRLVRMTGSGATCFALFETPNAAKFAARQLKKIFNAMGKKYWIKATILQGNSET